MVMGTDAAKKESKSIGKVCVAALCSFCLNEMMVLKGRRRMRIGLVVLLGFVIVVQTNFHIYMEELMWDDLDNLPYDRTVATRVSFDWPNRTGLQGPVCLKVKRKFFGRNCNRIIQIANGLMMARDMHADGIYLDQNWTSWYKKYLEDRDDVRFFVSNRHDPNCSRHVLSEEAHMYRPTNMVNPALLSLRLNSSIRQAAYRATKRYRRIGKQQHGVGGFVSVHRRNLEDVCRRWSRTPEKYSANYCIRGEPFLPSYEDWCDTVYQNITERHNRTVVLFTDRQRPEYDKTFPIRDENSFPVQLHMMTLSDLHYGVPISSIDYVVSHWRQGQNTKPHTCFGMPDNWSAATKTKEH